MTKKNGFSVAASTREEKEQAAMALRAAVLIFIIMNYCEDEIDAMSSRAGDVMRDGAALVLANIKATDFVLKGRIEADQQFLSCQVSFVRDTLMRRLEAKEAEPKNETTSAVTFSSPSSVLPAARISGSVMVRDPFLVG